MEKRSWESQGSGVETSQLKTLFWRISNSTEFTRNKLLDSFNAS